MKTFSKMMTELLRNYEQHYQFSLRLKMNHQSVYCGFSSESKSCHSFTVNRTDYLLECSRQEAEHDLRSIQIALMPFVNYSNEQCFAMMLDGHASERDISSVKNSFKGKQYVLILISGAKNLTLVKETLHQLLEEVLLCIHDECLWVLMNADLLCVLDSIRSTIETELYEKASLYASSRFEDLYRIQEYQDEVREIQSLIMKYDSSCLKAVPEDVWMLKLIDSLSEYESEKLLNTLASTGIKEMDEELILTAQAFMKNNLSISTTARELYVHRNTLIYRLDKIVQLTDLDIRKFEDAQKLCFVLKLLKK